MARTLVAHYRDSATAHKVVEALLEAGFMNDDLRLLVEGGRAHAAQDVTPASGAGFGALVGALVGIGSALVPGIGPVIGGGPLAVALTAGIGAAAGAVTGGIAAGALDMGAGDDAGAASTDGGRWDGTVVSLTTQEAWLEWAARIMMRHEPLKIEECPTPRRIRDCSPFNPAQYDFVVHVNETIPDADSSKAPNPLLKGHAHVYPYNH